MQKEISNEENVKEESMKINKSEFQNVRMKKKVHGESIEKERKRK